jgi:protein O-GlcNAc transferase
MKPDRNAPCPCGSGKKYKKCCGASGAGHPSAPIRGLETALWAFQQGRSQEALTLCQALLQQHPDHHDARHLAGLIEFQLGHFASARHYLETAASGLRNNAIFWSNLGFVRLETGDLRAADEAVQTALRINPNLADAYNTKGSILRRQGELRGALDAFQRASEIDPRKPEFLVNAASVNADLDDHQSAEATYRRVLATQAGYLPAIQGLAAVYLLQHRDREADPLLAKVVESGHADAMTYNNLGLIRSRQRDLSGAIEMFLQALKHEAKASIYMNLGQALEDIGKLSAAADAFESAWQHPDPAPDALKRLMFVAARSGDVDRVYEHARVFVSGPASSPELYPALIDVFGHACDFEMRRRAWQQFEMLESQNLIPEKTLEQVLMSSLYENRLDAATVTRYHSQWAAHVEARISKPYQNQMTANPATARLRIGFLSPDFRAHAVGYFIQHVLAALDRDAFEVHAYSLMPRTDDITEYIRQSVDQFVDLAGTDERQVAERIHRDKLDVLIDLAGHTAGGMPSVLAYRPAPMQMSWIGYLHASGLQAEDFRITDRHSVCPEMTDQPEKLLVLPDSFLCFGQFPEVERATEPPCIQNGFVTFASFNNLTKLTDEVIEVWARVLHRVADSRLMIVAAGADSDAARTNLFREFDRHGVASNRLEMRPAVPRLDYFALHNRADIILDTWPFNGGTITAGALWMGVPVVTRVGTSQRSRMTYSMLQNVNAAHTAARNAEEYADIATRLATDHAALASLRFTLGEQTRRSLLCDVPRFTRQLESALRDAWREHPG